MESESPTMTRARAQPSSSCMEGISMAWASSEIFERMLPLAEKRQEMFRQVFGGALPLPNPPLEGRPGMVRALRAAGVRTILPDMRGFGRSDKPREKAAYENSAMAR